MIYIFFSEGYEEVEAIAVVDVLRRAACDVTMVGVDDLKVKSTHGIEMTMDKMLSELCDPVQGDVFILPGGQPGTGNLSESVMLKQLFQKAYEIHCTVAAICAAPTVLDQWGLTRGKILTCYPSYTAEIKNADVVDRDVVSEPGLITARGVGVALEFGLEIVKHLKGSAQSEALRKAMVMPSS
ncbi:DJ-1/PfpI family protein [Fusibacter paucivorans]|uniref:DJ-1/PfpI family protein n=1 Tax=Fusibacter paucivorans TaxID=76009 RepID=A0ABS5PNG9_9FIRM|nr:DJ-1 family glyoxalase III [Fusibacter paucivorans]MBS7526725.1 DJ-1/PfpI family protein [Fusibacter paucivorans]